MVLDAEDRNFVKAEALDQPLSTTVTQPAIFPLALIGKQNTGEAVVEFVVNQSGFVCEPVIVSASEPMFGYSAVQAVSGWGYLPPRKNGKTVSTKTRVTIRFAAPVSNSGS
jgi:TonB family protein